jgi:hypothetical protein
MAAPDLIEIKDPDDLVDVDLLPVVFWRPAEQAKIIANSRRQLAPLNIILHASALVAHAHF